MKYKEAQRLLTKAIKEQKTIQTSKLHEIIMAMGISLKNDESQEVTLLKRQLAEARIYKTEYERTKAEFTRKGLQPKGGWKK